MRLTRLRIAGWAVLGTLLIALFATEFTSTAGPSKAGLSVRLQRGNLLQIVAKEPGIKVELYSLAGHRITEGHSTTNQLSLELPRSLANGVYLYVATANQDGRMRRVVGKIVVLRGRAFVQSPDPEPREPRVVQPVVPPDVSEQEAAKPVQGPKISAEDAQAALAYWTEERMRNAKPHEIVLPGGPSEPDDIEPLISAEAKQAGRIDGDVPTVFLNDQDRLMNQPGASAGLAPLHHWSGPPWPYNRFQMPLNPYTLYPARTIGKLFFTIPGVGDRVCSAAVVTSANNVRRIVWTAGHCVVTPTSSGPKWHTNVVFVPARRDGVNPLGSWTAAELWSINGWAINGSLRYDMGAIVTNLNAAGQRIGNVTGSLGFIWNAQYQQDYHSIGYPGTPFNGERQHVCTAGEARQDLPGSIAGPATNGIGCDATGGTSGGPWVTRLYPQRAPDDPLFPNYAFYMGCVTCYVNGVNSYRYDSQPRELFSPYCGTANGCFGLWDTVRNRDP
jgi:V8-like Glu-specific endopeptidase